MEAKSEKGSDSKTEMKKLDVAFVLPFFPVTTETFIVNQVIYLLERGHRVTIFSFSQPYDSFFQKNVLDYDLLNKVVYYNDPKVSKIGRYWDLLMFLIKNHKHIQWKRFIQVLNFFKYGKKALNLRNFLKYKWILDYGPFDILHAHFGNRAAYIAEMKKLGYFFNTGFITSFHGYDIKPNLFPTYRNQYKDLFEEVNLITVNSQYTYSLLKELTSEEKLRILPVGLDCKLFKKLEYKKGEDFTILFVGRFVEFKGPKLALEIINLLVSRGYREIKMILVGEGELKEEIQDYIVKCNLQKNVELTGALDQEDVIKIMNKADVFLLPGIYDKDGRAETQGLVIQEAQAMELPVIISDAGGMKNGMLDMETGFVVKAGDIKGFAEKIIFFIENEKQRKHMGECGRNYVLKNFDSELLGKQLETFYYSILPGR